MLRPFSAPFRLEKKKKKRGFSPPSRAGKRPSPQRHRSGWWQSRTPPWTPRWCGSRRSQRRGKKDPPSDGLFNTGLPGCLRRVRRLCRGKSPLEKAPLRREHPCGIFWTISAGNTIHRGRGIVVPESSWAARLGVHRGGLRLQPGTSRLCHLSSSVPDRNEVVAGASGSAPASQSSSGESRHIVEI